MIRRSSLFSGSLAAAAVSLTAACASAQDAVPPRPAPVAAAASDAPDSAKLNDLAAAGRFDELAGRLRQDAAAYEPALAGSLMADLQRFSDNARERSTRKQEAFEKAAAQLEEHVAAGKTEEALVSAIEAHGLTDDKAAWLDREQVKALVGSAVESAKAAEAAGDWVEALATYRLLNLLYEDTDGYHDQLRRTAKHVRVLQLYAPAALEELYRQRAQRRGDEEPKFEPGEREAWDVRLRGVEPSMLRQTLVQAARSHVNQSGYAPLMRGGLETLLIAVDTDPLADTFAGLKDKGKRTRFRDEVGRLLADLNGRDRDLTILDAATLIDRVLLINSQTLGLPESVVVYEMTSGATDTLDDFTAVIWPDDKEKFARATQGKFYGVGIQITKQDGRLMVQTPLENTPAQRAGVKAGDTIAQVDGRASTTWSLDRAVREITGPEGTTVTLGLERVGEANMLQVPLKRAEIEIESIRGWQHRDGERGGWDWWVDPDHRIAYIRLSQFIPQTADDLDAAIEQMQQDGPINGLVLDLRFNPGGLLSSAVDVADRFIPRGPLVFTVDAQGRRNTESRARVSRTYPDFPVVVLVNQGAASASEIVSGALQDYDRALIVGTRSFGKGSVQDLFPLAHGKAYLKLTTQYYMLPQGRIIHRKPGADHWGVEPDLSVQMTNREIADALELRQEADILRDPDAPQVPVVIAPAPAGDGEADEDEEKEAPRWTRPATAAQLLERGLDPQLEAALLVLKTRLLTQHPAVAKRE